MAQVRGHVSARRRLAWDILSALVLACVRNHGSGSVRSFSFGSGADEAEEHGRYLDRTFTYRCLYRLRLRLAFSFDVSGGQNEVHDASCRLGRGGTQVGTEIYNRTPNP